MGGLARKLRRKAKADHADWAVKAVKDGAYVSAVVNDQASTLRALLDNCTVHHPGRVVKGDDGQMIDLGIVRLPPGMTRELLASGVVYVNATVVKDPEYQLRPGDFVAVFPTEKLESADINGGQRVLRLRPS